MVWAQSLGRRRETVVRSRIGHRVELGLGFLRAPGTGQPTEGSED